jgi:hypothetical protein
MPTVKYLRNFFNRYGEDPPDDQDSSSRTRCGYLRTHEARRSTVQHGVGYKGRSRLTCARQLMNQMHLREIPDERTAC